MTTPEILGQLCPPAANLSGLFAYIDPQVGSYLFQLLIGGMIGGFFAAKQYWRSFKSLLARRPAGR
jgi:hypothetical protein